MNKAIGLFLIGFLLIGLLGCASWTKSQKGAAIGTTAGAVVGGIIGETFAVLVVPHGSLQVLVAKVGLDLLGLGAALDR